MLSRECESERIVSHRPGLTKNKIFCLSVFPHKQVDWKRDYFLMILFKYLLDISTGFSDLANQLPVFSMRK